MAVRLHVAALDQDGEGEAARAVRMVTNALGHEGDGYRTYEQAGHRCGRLLGIENVSARMARNRILLRGLSSGLSP